MSGEPNIASWLADFCQHMNNRTFHGLSQITQFPAILAIVVAAVSFLPGLHWAAIASHDNHRIAQVLVAIFGGAVIMLQLLRRPVVPTLFGKTFVFIGAFFGLGLWSGILAWSVPHAMFEWANFGLLTALAWLVANGISMARIRLLDRVLLVSGIGCALYLFSWTVTYISWLIIGGQPDWNIFIPGFDNYRFFNHVQTVTLPLLGLLVVRQRQIAPFPASATLISFVQRHQARFWWLVLVLWWTLFFVTAGRGTFLGLFAGLVMALVWRRRLAGEWSRTMISTFGVGLVAYPVLHILLPTLSGAKPFGLLQEVATRTAANPTSDRWALWHRAFEMIMEHPLLGAGPLHFAHYGRDIMNGAHPHNWLLQIGSEWGLPALSCMAIVLTISLRALLRAGHAIEPDDAPNQAILATWLATFVAIVVDGLVSGLFVMPSSQLWIALYAGCAWGWTASFSTTDTTLSRRTRVSERCAAMLGIVVMMFFVAQGLWPEIKDLPGHEQKIVNEGLKYGSDRLFPRIWRAGYF